MNFPAPRRAARPVAATPPGTPLSTRGFEIFLLGLIALGLVCRFVGLNWDEGLQLHPDERFVIDLVGKIGWPTSLAQWFDSTRSPFDPANLENTHYVYGQWPLLLGKLAALATGKSDLGASLPLARALSAVCDSCTVILTFVVARRALPRQWALFAAALVALSALHVQQSHFFTVDNFAAFWMLAAFWQGARWQARKAARATRWGAAPAWAWRWRAKFRHSSSRCRCWFCCYLASANIRLAKLSRALWVALL